MITASVWTAPAAVAAGLLAVAGAAKVARPHDTARALRAAGLAVTPGVVRVAAGAEVAIGAWALAGSRAGHALVSVSYAVFVAYLVFVLARGLPVSSCGCLGEPDVPPTWTHVGVDAAALMAAAGAAIAGAPGLADETARQALGGVPYLTLVVLGVVLAGTTISLLPRLRALSVARARDAGPAGRAAT